jgi:hypothetical protein
MPNRRRLACVYMRANVRFAGPLVGMTQQLLGAYCGRNSGGWGVITLSPYGMHHVGHRHGSQRLTRAMPTGGAARYLTAAHSGA